MLRPIPWPDQRAHDRQPGGLDVLLDRVRDVAEAVAAGTARTGVSSDSSVARSSFSATGVDRPDRERARGVGHPAVERHADVDREDVAAPSL